MPDADSRAVRQQSVLEWFQACEELRDALLRDADLAYVDMLDRRRGDLLARVMLAYSLLPPN